jgi:hypothetical protein
MPSPPGAGDGASPEPPWPVAWRVPRLHALLLGIGAIPMGALLWSLFEPALLRSESSARQSMRGRRVNQGRALSSCAASRNSVASSPKRPANWTPIGRPAAFQ